MKILRIFLVGITVFIVATIIGVENLLNSSAILKNFNILSVDNKSTKFTVEVEPVKAAVEYKITIISDDERKVFETTSKDPKTEIELTNLVHNKEYSLMVYAIDSVGDSRPANKDYIFVWNEPSIKRDISILLDNKDYTLPILGDLSSGKYSIVIKKGEEVVVNETLKKNDFVFESKYYKDEVAKFDVSIMNDDTVIDSITLFNKQNPITDMKITSLEENQVLPLNDVPLLFEGGDYAKEYTIQIYEEGKMLKETNTTKKQVIISKEFFTISKKYTFKIIAKYDKFEKDTEVNILMSDKEQLQPVYISNNWRYVKKGSKITLSCQDKDALIYYTLDGKSPESFGTLYTEPITIDKDVTIRTVAVNDKKYNSIIKDYPIHVGEKKELKVYISPSNQHRNLGVSEVGYTNEMDEMNDVANYVVERLEQFGVKVYRNNSSGNINLWLKDSNYYGVDVHLAIHSNASNEHDNYGVETWIHNETSNTFSLGNIIQENLSSIYPYKELENYNRGVKYANGALGEVNDNYLPFGILVEVAHHDYKNDALWMMQNKKLIGYNLADSILKYYQVID